MYNSYYFELYAFTYLKRCQAPPDDGARGEVEMAGSRKDCKNVKRNKEYCVQ